MPSTIITLPYLLLLFSADISESECSENVPMRNRALRIYFALRINSCVYAVVYIVCCASQHNIVYSH